MSHIDSFKHEIIGLFGCIPVYNPLEEIEGDFKAKPGQLILGGGSGEHPAMVVEDSTQAVALYLKHSLEPLLNPELSVNRFPLKKVAKDWLEKIQPFLTADPASICVFYDWTDEDHQRFAKYCTSDVLPNPHWKGDLYEWLPVSFGEFIFFAMPGLVPEVMEKLGENPHQFFNHIRYNNISLIPPNMPVYANGGNAFECRWEPKF
jgi:hypothetical protein